MVSMPRLRRVVGGEAFEVEAAVGAAEGDRAVGFDRQGPAAFVDEVVVAFAQRQQVGQVGGAEVVPPGT